MGLSVSNHDCDKNDYLDTLLSIENQQINLLKIKAQFLKQELVKTNSLIKHSNQKNEIFSKTLKNYKLQHISKKHLLILSSMMLVFFSGNLIDVDSFMFFDSYASDNTFMKSKFVIENLRGDTIDTMKSWRILSDDSLNVNLLNGDVLTKEQYDAVTKVIMSTDSIQLDDFILNKGQLGSESTYYLGWAGAMSEAKKTNTVYSIPAKYTIMQSLNGEGDIIIDFSNLIDVDGFSGYTRSVLSDGEILKAYITIYDVENLEASELATILRHEFGHALGLGHSSDPEDLMAPAILTDFPYISECNVDAMAILYDGHESDKAVCEK